MSEVTSRLSSALADHYRIEHRLGEGGMATVYLAEDLKHGRKVALKVLKPELAAVLGAERFVQEIKTTAQLQHPNILALFDSGEVASFLYYVMPYVEGETLRDKLNREKQLGIDEAVKIASEVAEALDYAHRHDVIHRDIKPENILLHDGRPMVADFGIALAVSAAAGGRMTETGLSLGTPHYMSPEQATAEKDITARSDVYSLASVLYEMLTGSPPHVGSSAQQIIMKIVTDEARPVTELRKSVPPNVTAAVSKALEKLPADRFESASKFAEALTNAAFTSPAIQAAPVAGPAASGLWKGVAIAATALAALFLVTTWWGWLLPGTAASVSRQRVVLWEFTNPNLPLAARAALAPDGSSIVYTDTVGDGFQLMRKLRDDAEAVPLAGTENASLPFFSPDGEWIGFLTSDGKLRKVPSGGGGSLTLAENASVISLAAAWLDDNSIIYVNDGLGLSRVAANGGHNEVVTNLITEVGLFANNLSPLPRGRGILFTGCAGNCVQSSVYLYDIFADTVHLLFEDGNGVWYAPTGHVLYTSQSGGLYAAEFDVGALATRGGVVAVLDGVQPMGFTHSSTGTALYSVGGVSTTEGELVWVARDGTTEAIDADWRENFSYPAVSPDGTKLAVSAGSDETHLWIKQLGAGQQKLTFEGTVNWRPAWTPDGRAVAFVSNREGTSALDNDLYVRRADGSASSELLLNLDVGMWEVDYSPDGQWLLYRVVEGPGVNSNVYAKRLEGDTASIPLLVGEHLEQQFALSPNGQWLAYVSNESGRWEVYVVPFPDADSRWMVSSSGGLEPRWAHSGRELFYKGSDGVLMSVEVPPGTTFTYGEPQSLFSLEGYFGAANRQQYDVAPDDNRFVMIRGTGAAEAGQLVYVENFFEELKAKVGTRVPAARPIRGGRRSGTES